MNYLNLKIKGSGYENSIILDGYPTSAEANNYCRSIGYYFPSKNELLLIYMQRTLIDALDTSGGANTLTALNASRIWSSSESTSSSANTLTFSNRAFSTRNKSEYNYVIPIRRIIV